MRYVIAEARKTQPDAIYVIFANSLKWPPEQVRFHNITDYMRPSANWLSAINAMAEISDTPWSTRMKLLFPVLETHGNWNSLPSRAYVADYNHVKTGSAYDLWLNTAEDQTGKVVTSDKIQDPDPDFAACLEDLFGYLKDEHVRVVFVRIPQIQPKEFSAERLNYVCSLVDEWGFDLIDLEAEADQMGLDLASDFYNGLHTNSHGSIKFTYCLGQHLVERYGLKDKRGDAAYADWEDAATRYETYLRTGVLPFELEHAPRATTGRATDIKASAGTGSTPSIALSWAGTEGADGIQIYRRERPPEDYDVSPLKDTSYSYLWELVAELPGDASTYEDTDVQPSTTYRYRVVSTYDDGGTLRYGPFDINGVKTSTGDDAS
jgi:hypothetical protein